MRSIDHFELAPVKIKPYIFALTLIWTMIAAGSLIWNLIQIKRGTLELVQIQAEESFNKDVLYRRWNARHGGVYAPITEATPVNPYLKVSHRDIPVDPDLVLTLVNPAYMTRQIHEMAANNVGIKGHITSLDPIRQQNRADAWEAVALEAFENGRTKVSSVENMNGINYLRFMRPLMTEESCLKCHAEQGYKVGDIRGGISVAVPIAPYMAIERSSILRTSIGHGLLWLFGLVFVGIGMHRLNRQLSANHKLSTDALMERETRYRGIFNESVAAIYIIDAQKTFLDANQAGLDLLGYTRDELLCMRINDVGDDGDGLLSLHHLSGGEKIVNHEHRLKKKDGGVITVINNSIPIADADGRITGMQSTLIDISLRKQVEQELRDNQARLRTLINAMPDLVWLKDPDGVYMACNTRFERFIGKKEADLIGSTDFDLMASDVAEFFRFHDQLAIERCGPTINEEEISFADDGHCEILETINTPVYGQDGHLAGVLGIGRDITERKLKEKMQAAKLRLIDFFINALGQGTDANLSGRSGSTHRKFNRVLSFGRSGSANAFPSDLVHPYPEQWLHRQSCGDSRCHR